jgi:predicted MFS family arabinose efflux permease
VTEDKPARYRDVFADPVFRTLFGSRTLSIAANTLRMLALSVLVFENTGSALLTAVAFGIGFVPQVLGGTTLGSLADRLPARGLIVGGTLLDGALALGLALVPMPVGAALGLVAVGSIFSPVFHGAANRLIAETLTGDAYVVGRSLSNVASSGAQLVGLALGGIAVAAVGPARALLVSAACHIAAATWARLGLPRMAAPQRASGRGAVGQSWRITRELWQDRVVRRLLLVQWIPPAFVTGAESIMVPYTVERGFPDGSVGVLLAAVPVGMLIGNIILGRLVRPATRERLVAPILVLFGVPMILLALPLPLWVTVLMLFVVGMGMDYSLGLQRAFLDALDPRLRGQAFALNFTGLMTMQGVGPVVSGAVADLTHLAVAMALMGAGTLLVGAVWWRVSAVASPPGRGGTAAQPAATPVA